MVRSSALARLVENQKLALAGVWAGVIAVTAYLYFINPATFRFHPKCSFYALSGFYCPGCGTSRALHQLLHGNLLGALAFNPLAVIVLPYLIYSLISYSLLVIRGRPLPGRLWPGWVIYAFLGVLIAFWILRNIPAYPFTWLAPG